MFDAFDFALREDALRRYLPVLRDEQVHLVAEEVGVDHRAALSGLHLGKQRHRVRRRHLVEFAGDLFLQVVR